MIGRKTVVPRKQLDVFLGLVFLPIITTSSTSKSCRPHGRRLMFVPRPGLNNSNLPNPLSPEAWLPYEGNSYTIYTAVAFGLLSVWVWDILTSLPDEIKLFLECRFSLQTVCYCVARICPLPFFIVHNTLLTQDVKNCPIWAFFLSLFFATGQVSAGLIFLLRVRAVYGDQPRVKLVVSTAWVAYAACHLLPFLATHSTRIEPLRRCMWSLKSPYPSILCFAETAYDLLICVAVTYKISHDVGKHDQLSSFWWSFGMRQSHFSKLRARFLLDSQLYFVVAFALKITGIIVYFSGNALVLLIFGLLDNFLISIIACKIHRKFRLGKPGLLKHSHEMTSIGNISTKSPTSRPVDVQEVPNQRRGVNEP
ncbi:hypothetical protein CPB83DRAFT_513880 [Crepidotus variabilis]|uniref:DUF6533 domain-containing protein n=1 Tax=Crepidotus variabilis TaxID=179855 RepID=A0A9P6EB81_9AGAR|nr:hypothetical protein CPB83DRAFT_513880 [Crepidotus variabilis]